MYFRKQWENIIAKRRKRKKLTKIKQQLNRRKK